MKVKKWELALFTALAVTMLFGTGLVRRQMQLSEKIIRLHVVANSDTDEDQALKLEVRDRVMRELEPMLSGVTQRGEAAEIIAKNLTALETAATETVRTHGYDYNVSASIADENFPTREYETFTLPAGRYESLRLEIGAGAGKNWWCVVFPPLCTPSETDFKAALEVLSDDEITLITEDGAGYTVKFKTLEILAKFRGFIMGKTLTGNSSNDSAG